jgi:uncharacterized protein HemY
MWRALAFLALLALAAFGAVWIADRPGTVTVVWNGYQIGTSLAVALVGVIAAAIVLGLLWAIVRGVIGLPEALVRGSAERRRAKGLSALSRGMVAVGSGDPLAARRYAGDAERLLGTEPLTLLLKAQAAQISGDRDAAESAFQRMVDDPETRVLGLRGLFVEARRREDETAARAYATEAARLAPSVTWANEALLEAQSADGDWAAALETIERRSSLGLIDKAAARRQRAVLLTAIAGEREAGEPELATERVLQAVKLAPDLVPAACIAGRLLARRGDVKKAARIVEAAWKANPHPDLAKVYLGLRPGDSVRDRLARAEVLAKLSVWDPESRLALGQAALDARGLQAGPGGREAPALRPSDRPGLPDDGGHRGGRARGRLRSGPRVAGQGRPRPARPRVDRRRHRHRYLGAGLAGDRASRRLRVARAAEHARCRARGGAGGGRRRSGARAGGPERRGAGRQTGPRVEVPRGHDVAPGRPHRLGLGRVGGVDLRRPGPGRADPDRPSGEGGRAEGGRRRPGLGRDGGRGAAALRLGRARSPPDRLTGRGALRPSGRGMTGAPRGHGHAAALDYCKLNEPTRRVACRESSTEDPIIPQPAHSPRAPSIRPDRGRVPRRAVRP